VTNLLCSSSCSNGLTSKFTVELASNSSGFRLVEGEEESENMTYLHLKFSTFFKKRNLFLSFCVSQSIADFWFVCHLIEDRLVDASMFICNF
jgi:hypothetical protein